MALRPVLVIPDQRLRQKAKPVACVNDSIRTLIADMYETMDHEEGCGLAAPQIGVGLRLFVMDTTQDAENGMRRAFINPVITESSKNCQTFTEGCLSVPGQSADVKRPDQIILEYIDEVGNAQKMTFSGFTATCIQHEMDHLDGKLYIDYLSSLKKNIIINRVKKSYA